MLFRGFTPAVMEARCQGRMLRRRVDLIGSVIDGLQLEQASILEIGAGTGLTMRLVAERCGSHHYRGIEPVREYVAYARDKHQSLCHDLRFDVGALESQDLPANSFDLAYSVNVWHHIPRHQLRLAASNLVRVLKPGGLYVSLEPNWRNTYIFLYQALMPGERNFFPWREQAAIADSLKLKTTTFRFAFPEIFRVLPNSLERAELALERIPLLAGSVLYIWQKPEAAPA